MRDMMMRGVLAVGLVVVCGMACGQQQANKPVMLSRDDVVKTIADARRIVSPNGIKEGRAIAMNGTQQRISVRGRDRRNPILLLVHGGPGSPEMPDDWTFQSPWEDYFTVVEWVLTTNQWLLNERVTLYERGTAGTP
jgi:proline iminopeptidase